LSLSSGIEDAARALELFLWKLCQIDYWSRDWFIVLLDERWHGDSYRIHDNLQHFITYPEWISPARHKRSYVANKVMSIANFENSSKGYFTNVGYLCLYF